MQDHPSGPNLCEFCEKTETSDTETCFDDSSCFLNTIYSVEKERGREQIYYFNLLDRLKVCSYCEISNPDLLVLQTHESSYICCSCAKTQSEEFRRGMIEFTIGNGTPIKSTERRNQIIEESEHLSSEEVNLFDLLKKEVENCKRFEQDGSNKVLSDANEVNGKPKASNLNKNNAISYGSNDMEELIVDKAINWDYVSATYFLSDYSQLNRKIKMLEEKVNRPFGFDLIEPINVTFGSYLDRFSETGIVRIPIDDRKVFIAVLGYLKKYNIYKITDTPELTGHFSLLTVLQDNHISNLIEAINQSDVGIVDYLKLLKCSYLFAQSRAQGYLNKISSQFSSDVHYYREYARQNIEAQNRIEYIRICDIIKGYRNLSAQYLGIEKDLEYYTSYVRSRINFKLNKDENSHHKSHLNSKHHKETALVGLNPQNGPMDIELPPSQISNLKIQERPDIAIESDCSVCFVADTSYFNPIVYCTGCEMGGHIKCVGLSEVPSDNYFCHKCYHVKQQKFCIICGLDSYFLQRAKDSQIAYHTFCAFADKAWIYRAKSTTSVPNKMKSNSIACMYCNSYKGEIETCVDCKSKYYHMFCGYLNGHHYKAMNYDKLNFDDFMEDKYNYEVEMRCDNCSREHFQESLTCDSATTDLLFLKTKYLRRASIDPKFNRTYLEFEDYAKQIA